MTCLTRKDAESPRKASSPGFVASWRRLAVAGSRGEAVAAIDRLVSARLERHLGNAAALAARRLEHLAMAASAAALRAARLAGGAAVAAAIGLIREALHRIEFLFAGGEGELASAIHAGE